MIYVLRDGVWKGRSERSYKEEGDRGSTEMTGQLISFVVESHRSFVGIN